MKQSIRLIIFILLFSLLLLFLLVPPPTVVVQVVNPNEPLVSGTARNLTCTVTLANVNDINVAVNFTWITNMSELTLTNRITTYLTSQSGNQSTFTSTLIFYPLDDSVDSRMYRCNVRVDSAPSSVFITPTTATNTTNIDVQRESIIAVHACVLILLLKP